MIQTCLEKGKDQQFIRSKHISHSKVKTKTNFLLAYSFSHCKHCSQKKSHVYGPISLASLFKDVAWESKVDELRGEVNIS